MGTITTGVGLISGLNSKDIIDQLMQIESRKKTLVQARVDAITVQKTAYTDITAQLTGLRISAQTFAKPSFFTSSQANSSNEDVLTATASKGAAVGSYQFQVARLVQSQQMVSKGYADFDTAPVGAGTLTVELGGGEVTQENRLSDLRGGQGVSRGQIRITDRSGKSAIVDTTDAVSLDDLVKKINNTYDINVQASVVNDRLTLTDRTGSILNDLTVQDIGTTTTAADLGIATNSNTGAITGGLLQFVGRDTRLATLNDGNGVANKAGTDFHIAFGNGTSTDIDIGSSVTIGDVIDKINTAAAGRATASVSGSGNNIQIVDANGTITITAINGSTTASDLGILKAGTGNTLAGDQIVSSLGTVMLKTLKGGAGVTLGTINVTNRSGTATAINLSTTKTVKDVLDTINAANAGVKAEINSAGNGIQLTDTSGGTGNVVIADTTGTGAAQLGIAGTFTPDQTIVKGANLQRKWVSGSTSLATYNGGKGIATGKFEVTAGDGTTKIISIDSTTDLQMNDVIGKINAAFAGKVVASVNTNGDGLLLTDASGGAGKMSVKDDGGTTASDLGIDGTATATTIDGTREKTITITATDTLTNVQTKINTLGYGVSAQIINDGTGAAPYRLSLNTTNSGMAGRVTFDSGATKLDTRTLVKAQDAAVFVGSSDAAQPLLITASRNQISGVIKGVNIDLHGISKEPVTINVTRDIGDVGEQLGKFVEAFNGLNSKIKEYQKFDTDTLERGPLLGDSATDQVSVELFSMISTVVPEGGKFRILADVGFTVDQDGNLQFDQDKFNTAYSQDPSAVEKLFTSAGRAISDTTKLSLLNNGTGVQLAANGAADIRATLKDGSTVDVSFADNLTLGQAVDTLNAVSPNKLHAEITDDGRIKLSDLTTGTTTFKLAQLNASQAMYDLGLSTTQAAGVITGKILKIDNAINSITGGIGVTMQQRLNKLIDPVSGVISRQNKNLDERSNDYEDRMKQLDSLLAAKRSRLERQFMNLESSLSQLQGQQRSLGSIQTISAPS